MRLLAKSEEKDRVRAAAPHREALARAMTRLNRAHWELDHMVESWIDRASPTAEDVQSLQGDLQRAAEEYAKAYDAMTRLLLSDLTFHSAE